LVEEYTIADIATFPWVNALGTSYGAGDVLPVSLYPHVEAWLARCKARPAYDRGKDVTSLK
jgi:GST-like protein